MIQKDDVLLKRGGEWLHFANPRLVVSATISGEVRNALREVERLVNANNWHAAGFVGYEAAPAFDDALRVLSAGDFPLLWFGLYSEPRILKPCEVFRDVGCLTALNWQANVERENYNAAIEKIKEAIAQGKTYQVNYTMRLNANFNGNVYDFFQSLAQSPNQYAAYIDIGRYAICSFSPELFFELDGENIVSRPMKGTASRGRTQREDAAQAEWLRRSIKNRAENVMIADMVRNDLGRIAEIGSVRAPELFAIEKYPSLFQMTSTVQAKTRASLDEIFTALFPCASITGAPKVSAMKIIAEVETSPRKIYTGSVGFISPRRKAQFNVAIRTALIDRENQTAEYGVGGGIVWDSVSADEYDEALLKARALTAHPQEFSLIETLLWTSQDGYFLREKHIERMKDSAEYFDFEFSKEKLAAQLYKVALHFNFPQRVRVLLNKAGEATVACKAVVAFARPFKVRLAEKPVNSNDVFLFHKTTRREMYPSVQGCDDVLLYNERNELTEFTIGNLVVEMDGELFTPPISCGLLAGTFRAHLMETGQVKERGVYKSDLGKCAKIFLVNSVRKWVEVVMQEKP